MIFYSSSPEPHVAQILGRKLWAEIMIVATSTIHLGHTWTYAWGQQNNQVHTPYMSKPLSRERALQTEVHFEVKCFTCSLLHRNKMLGCQRISRFTAWVSKSVEQRLYLPEVVQNVDRGRRGASISMRNYMIKARALNLSPREHSLSADPWELNRQQ